MTNDEDSLQKFLDTPVTAFELAALTEGVAGAQIMSGIVRRLAYQFEQRAERIAELEAVIASRDSIDDCIREIRGDVDDRTLIDRLVALQGFIRHGRIEFTELERPAT